MERKKRVSVGMVLMGFFLIFVMLGGAVALVAHEVILRGSEGLGGDMFSVVGALHVLLGVGMKSGRSMAEALLASPKDYIAVGLMLTGILMFIISGFTKNHIVYLISILMTGASVFVRRIPAFLTDIRFMEQFMASGKASDELKVYNTVSLVFDGLILAALVFLLVIWLLSLLKDVKVKNGTGDPDKSLVIGFIPGLLLILVYLGILSYELAMIVGEVRSVSSYIFYREGASLWASDRDVESYVSLALVLRYLFLSFQFGLLILFTGLWLNRPYKKLSAEEKAAAALAAKKAEAKNSAPFGQPYDQQYGPQYGSQMNQQYGAPYGPQYGPQYNPQYNQQYGPQMNQQYGPQYAQQMDRQYGAPYGPQYAQQMDRQYGAPYSEQVVPTPVPVPIPVPVEREPEKTVEELREEAAPVVEEIREEAVPVVEEIREEAAPVLEEIREEAAAPLAETVEEFKEDVTAGFNSFGEQAAQAVEEVKEEAAAPVAEAIEEVKEEAAPVIEEVKEEVKEARPAFKFCPSCGFKLLGVGRFCPSCGYKLHD